MVDESVDLQGRVPTTQREGATRKRWYQEPPREGEKQEKTQTRERRYEKPSPPVSTISRESLEKLDPAAALPPLSEQAASTQPAPGTHEAKRPRKVKQEEPKHESPRIVKVLTFIPRKIGRLFAAPFRGKNSSQSHSTHHSSEALPAVGALAIASTAATAVAVKPPSIPISEREALKTSSSNLGQNIQKLNGVFVPNVEGAVANGKQEGPEALVTVVTPLAKRDRIVAKALVEHGAEGNVGYLGVGMRVGDQVRYLEANAGVVTAPFLAKFTPEKQTLPKKLQLFSEREVSPVYSLTFGGQHAAGKRMVAEGSVNFSNLPRRIEVTLPTGEFNTRLVQSPMRIIFDGSLTDRKTKSRIEMLGFYSKDGGSGLARASGYYQHRKAFFNSPTDTTPAMHIVFTNRVGGAYDRDVMGTGRIGPQKLQFEYMGQVDVARGPLSFKPTMYYARPLNGGASVYAFLFPIEYRKNGWSVSAGYQKGMFRQNPPGGAMPFGGSAERVALSFGKVFFSGEQLFHQHRVYG